MPIEIANIPLPRVHRVVTQERADFISHRIPGLSGNVVQDMGRQSVRLRIDGIFYGDKAQDDLEALRDVFKDRLPVDFLAEIVGQAYFAQVIIEQLDVQQAAHEPEQFSYQLTVAEYVPPPTPAAGLSLPDIDAALALDALDFMSMIQLPDLLGAPDFGDPTPPLKAVQKNVADVLAKANAPTAALAGVFGGTGASAARSFDAAAGSDTTILGTNVSDAGVLNLITEQLNKLLSAGDSATDAGQQSGSGIQTVQRAISRVGLPNIDKSSVFRNGFASIAQNSAHDGSILRGVTEGIDGLFSDLETSLVGRLSDIFDRFKTIGSVGGGGGNSPLLQLFNLPNLPDTMPLPAMATRGLMAAAATEPLTAQALLEYVSVQLDGVSREKMPLQNVPIFDELRDKLHTVLGWLRKDAAALSTELAESTQTLSVYIQDSFYQNTLTPLKTDLQNVAIASNWSDLQTTLTAMPNTFSALAAMVNRGILDDADDAIAELQNHIATVRTANQKTQQTWLNTEGVARRAKWVHLGENLETEMSNVLFLTTSSNELKIIGLAIQPLNDLLTQTGINAFVGGLHELFGAVENFINSLNISAITGEIEGVINDAAAAIQSVQDLLVRATVELSRLLNRVKDAISDLDIAGVVQQIEHILTDFERAVVNGLVSVFEPVRRLLQTVFGEINGLVDAFDPEKIIAEVLALLQVLTNVLTDKQLLDTINAAKAALGTITGEIGDFSIRPVTSVVIDGIGVVDTAFGIIGQLPLPDSVKKEVNKALNAIPKDIRPATDKITEGFSTVVDEGAKPALLAIKDKPTELVHLVENYSPDKYLTEKLFEPYQKVVGKIAELKPTVLMQPVKAELDKLTAKISSELDPMKIFTPLQSPFDSIVETIHGLNPEALIAPLQQKITEGVHAITSKLPLSETDAVFDKIDGVAGVIRQAIEKADAVKMTLDNVNTRLSGLQNADVQIQTFGDQIAAKLDNLTDFTAILAALTALDMSVDSIAAAPLKDFIEPILASTIAQLESLAPQNRLLALVEAKRVFPRAALDALPDSPQKTALQGVLNNFVPTADVFAKPLGSLEDVLTELKLSKANLATTMATWQARYHNAQSPLQQFRQKDMSVTALKTLLKTTVREQLTATLRPIFSLISKFQTMVAAVVEEISTLIEQLETQLEGLVHINDALQNVRDKIHGLVDKLNGLDITFVATEIKAIFEAVTTQLEALNPTTIGTQLKVHFDHILGAIDPNVLLGLAELDALHATLVALIESRDPRKILLEAAQPEFDKVLNFLKEFEIQDIITGFLTAIEHLRTDLTTELDKTADAYDQMIKNIPSDYQSKIGVSVSI